MEIVDTGKREFWINGNLKDLVQELRKRGASGATWDCKGSLQISHEEALELLADKSGSFLNELIIRRLLEQSAGAIDQTNADKPPQHEESGISASGYVKWENLKGGTNGNC
jgi:hypothetical protein